MAKQRESIGTLAIICGDQLDAEAELLGKLDPKIDRVWMAEVSEEISYVPSHKQRIVLFLSAMRHFRDELRDRGFKVEYHQLTNDPANDRGNDFAEILRDDLARLRPQRIAVTLPGDFRVKAMFEGLAEEVGIPLEVLPDRHFYCKVSEFVKFAQGRKSLLMENFYRWMRKRHDVLMDQGKPEGGTWNFDHDNRDSLPTTGPEKAPPPRGFRPDAICREVIELVENRYSGHPGSIESFNLPVTRRQALAMLRHFIKHRLPQFGQYEDAMWTDEPFLYHSRLSTALNLKLLNPRECVSMAIEAYHGGEAPLNSVEGFVRQILGWREFVRGIYWQQMPEYEQLNALGHHGSLPSFYWDGQTEMQCVRQSMGHVLAHGYAHHIHRLMVLGNLALTWGVDPWEFHRWHMAMYLDAVDWVSLPNTLGMSQHGDGGIVGTKPYVSTGNYIHKMSNFCQGCRFDYRQSTGENACPITTLYWDFLDRHFDRFQRNMRMKFQMNHVKRKRDQGEMEAIRAQADLLRESWK